MSKHLPHINLEKYAAYLDGNLPDDEMRQMEAFIHNDPAMKAFVEEESFIDAISNAHLYDNGPITEEIDLSSIGLPSLDGESPFESNGFVDVFFQLNDDRFDEEMGSLINDGVNHRGLLYDANCMNDSCEVEDGYLGFAANEGSINLSPESPHDWSPNDVNLHDELTNNELTTPSMDDDL